MAPNGPVVSITLDGNELLDAMSKTCVSMTDFASALGQMTIGVASMVGTFDAFSGAAVASIADPRSPAFAEYAAEQICTTYGIPPCDEVFIEFFDDPINCNLRLEVTVLGFTSFHFFSQLELMNYPRHRATWIMQAVMNCAASCWEQVIK